MTSSVAVEEVESVVSEEVEEVALSVQESESVPIAATSEEKLEVNKDSCRCVERAVCERQPAPILALAQFDQETGSRGNSQYCLVQREETGKKHTSHTSHTSHTPYTPHTPLSEHYWGNSCQAVEKRQEESEVGNGRGKFLLPSRSPPCVGKLEYIAVFNEVR
ncbi:hypothetical protein [Moorena sp. SIO3H5]|uniref:hypothetical protein n=1 Tax=Moorena sp. SIO3H5 TaxID=2607834 RepID=UPI0013BD68ED|nr:hypothetical protein [Moorena sp. SIO3H5]NEO74548.1 hypothetical protein [Moorena sp. SIO3H5]